MKPFFLATPLLCCLPAFATSTVPEQVINSCLKAQSTRAVRYVDLSPTGFSIEEDDHDKRNATTIVHRRHKFGYWESTSSDDFGLVYDSTNIPIANVERIGSAMPEPFVPYTALWGEARYGKQRYLCITFNFEGLGQSGSFQNVRGTYAINLHAPPKFYYAVGDIRAIKD